MSISEGEMSPGELREVLELMRLHQIRNRFVGTVSTEGLTTLQSYVLIEIDINPLVSISELCSLLHVERNSISRAISALEQTHCIVGAANPDDRRKRIFSIQKAGYEHLDFHEENDREFLNKHLRSLSVQEISELSRFYQAMSDAVGMPQIQIRPSEHPFLLPLRRLTRAYGFVGPSLFGSGHSSVQWHVLSAIQYSEKPQTLSQLADLLHLNVVSLSQRLKRYQQQGLLKARLSRNDRRCKILTLTTSGKRRLQEIEQSGISLLKGAFDGMHADQLARFLELSRKYVGKRDSSLTSLLRPALSFSPIRNTEERDACRKFVLFHRVRLGLYQYLPDRLIADDTTKYVVREGGAIVALCELQIEGENAKALHFVYSALAEHRQIVPEFLVMILSVLKTQHRISRLAIPGWNYGELNLPDVEVQVSDRDSVSFALS